MSDIPDLSKEAQLDRATSRDRRLCPDTGHRRSQCECWSCRNRRNRRKGRQGQRRARTALHLTPEPFTTRQANEEDWRALVRVEVKAGSQVSPVATAYRKARAQSDLAKAIGDTRPFVAAFAPDGEQMLIVIREDDLAGFVHAMTGEWNR